MPLNVISANCIIEQQIDAVLLGTKRIGHGFGIVKYPNVLKMVKERKIGIEVNPLSNQVLKLVDDLRNHPCAVLMSDDYPVVISRQVVACAFVGAKIS